MEGAVADVPVYRGKFGEREATRLLWRAGFGPKPGEAAKLARKHNLRQAVHSLTRPAGAEVLKGPEPLDDDGYPIAPFDAWGHDVLWWLDRMVRTNQPLVERMALIWHDWFATGDVGPPRLSIEQAQLFERRWMGPFSDLLLDVTANPAMLIWLSGVENTKRAPNENYAREMMELFTLGASDASGYPYSETDVREQARALTGWTNSWTDEGPTNFRFDSRRFDTGTKTIFGQTGNFGWADSCALCVNHPAHKGFFVSKLWSYFIAAPPSTADRQALEHIYVAGGFDVRPVVEAILMHPSFYRGPAMVKPPIVYIAGLHRARRKGVRGDVWSWATDLAGQRLFRPPNVSGWDDSRWLDTSTFRGRWIAANEIVGDDMIDDDSDYPAGETANAAVKKAMKFWGKPLVGRSTYKGFQRYAAAVERAAKEEWEQESFRLLRQNALRALIATSPEMQVC